MSQITAVLDELVPGGVRERWCERNGRRLHVVCAGGGEDTVVFEAGRNDVALTWTPLLIRLAPFARLVAYDRAGLGESDPADGPATFDRLLGDLAAVLEGAGPGRRVLVGHSFGGRLAHLFAAHHPDQIAGAILVDPGLPGLGALQRTSRGALVRQVARYGTGALAHRPLGVARSSRRAVASFTADPARRRVLAAAARRRARRGDELAGCDLEAPEGNPPPFGDAPLVVLSASRHRDGALRERFSALQGELAAAAPAGRHVVIQGCGHAIHHECPDRVAEAVVEVLGRVYGNNAR